MARTVLRMLAFAAVVVATAACGGEDDAAAPARGAVSDLTSVDQLAAAFAAGGGKPRLVLLLSPT